MHVFIATDGNLDVDRGAALAARLAGSDGSVTVFTAVEIPRSLLSSLRAGFDEAELLILDRESVEVRATESREHSGWPGDDAVIDRYLHDRGEAATGPIAAALREHGVEPTIVVREAESVGAGVLGAIRELAPDVVCIGSHGSGRFEGLLGSTGNKITRLSPYPVLIVRTG